MPRPAYLDDETARLLSDTRLSQQLDDAVSGIRAPHALTNAIRGIRKIAYGDENATSWTPLPIVVSDRPDAMAIAQQQRQQAMPQQSAAPVLDTAPPTPETPTIPTFKADDFQHDPETGKSVYRPSTDVASGLHPGGDPSSQPVAAPQSGAPSGPPPGADDPWGQKAYAAAVKAGHPNPSEFVEQMRWESGNFAPDVISGQRNSTAGAQGIAQIMPATGQSWGVNPLDPDAALAAAARHMTEYYAKYGGDSDRALAAYNMGEGNLQRYGPRGLPETNTYLDIIHQRTGQGTPAPTAAPTGTGAASSPAAAASPPASAAAGASVPQGSGPIRVRDPWGNEWNTTQAELNRRPGGYADLTVLGPAAMQKVGDTQTAADTGGPSAGDQKRAKLAAAAGTPAEMPVAPMKNGQAIQPVPESVFGVSDWTANAAPALSNQRTEVPYDPATGQASDTSGLQYRQPLSSNMGPDTATGANEQALPDMGSPNFDPRDADQGAHEAGYTDDGMQPSGDSGTTSAGAASPSRPTVPASPANDPGGAQFAAQDSMSQPAASAPNRRYDPFGGSSDPTADATRSVQPDTSPTSPTSTQVPVWDDNGQVIGYRQAQAPAQRQNQQRLSDGTGQVSSTPGEPDYVPSPPNRLDTAADALANHLTSAGGALTTKDRIHAIEDRAARDQGLSGPLDGMQAVNDPTWRAQNPDLAAEYDDLQLQFAMVVGGQTGDVPHVLGNTGKALREAAGGGTIGRGGAPMDASAQLGWNPMPRFVEEAERRGMPANPWEMTSQQFTRLRDQLTLSEGRGEVDRIARVVRAKEDLPTTIRQMGEDLAYDNPGLVRRLQNVKPETQVTVYRGVDAADPNAVIRPGDWVALERRYAADHAAGRGKRSTARVLTQKLPASDIAWAGTSADEWIYAPPALRDATGDMSIHEAIVRDALQRGETVPASVLAEYPDLAQRGEPPGKPGIGSRIRGALDANAANVAAADARAAEAGSTAAHGTLGVVTGNPLEANTAARSRVIPPDVSDTLDFPVRVPTDPNVIRAIEAAGGSVDPERGVNLNVIRMQGPEAAGKPATRSSTFYTAGKKGEASPYAAGEGAAVGGSERIEAPTTYRSPLVLSDAPGSNTGFDAGMRQLGQESWQSESFVVRNTRSGHTSQPFKTIEEATAYIETLPESVRKNVTVVSDAIRDVPTGQVIDRGINAARRAGPPGSPERAQALKDLVSRYGGDEHVIDDLLALRGADHSESAWAIKENILAHNARAKGYDGVLTVQQDMAGHEYQAALTKAVEAHPDWQAQNEVVKTANARYNEAEQQATEALQKFGKHSPEQVAAYHRLEQASYESARATRKLDNIHDRLVDTVQVEVPHKITELADFRESHNPTPGDTNPEIAKLTRALRQAERALQNVPDPTSEQIQQAMATVAEARRQVERTRSLEPYVGSPGYTLRSDIPRRGPPQADAATLGAMSPEDFGAPKPPGVMAALGRTASSEALNAAGGAFAANVVSGDLSNDPNDTRTPQERARDAILHAGAGAATAIGLRHGVRAIRSEGGALATFGASPNYRPPTPAALKAAEVQGARRGEMLNREVTPPGSSVPRGARLATALTDPLAATRYAENLLTDTAGAPRLPENSPLRASTLLRENPTGFIKDRIENELAAPVKQAAQQGLQTDLPRFLEDTHQKDILDTFYTQGKQDLMDQRQPAIDAAKARGVAPAIIQRMEAKAAADAEVAGTATMRRRQGSNPQHTYEATDARLQEQQQRLTASGQFGDLQTLAQQIWDASQKTLDNSVAAGRVEPQVAADLKAMYPHYVPTVPISKLDPGGRSFGASSGGTTVGASKTNPIHALEDVGSSSERLNPIVAVRNQIVTQERQNHQNQVFQAFAQLMDNAGVPAPGTMGKKPNLWEGERQISGRINGQPETRMVPASVANGIESMTQAGMGPDAAVNVYKRVVGWFAGQLTAARASYIPLNLARDAGDTFFNTMIKNGGPARLPQVMGTWLDEASRAVADVAAAQATPRGIIGAAGGFAYGSTQIDEPNAPISTRLLHGAEAAIPGAFLLGANKNVNISSKAANEFISRGGASGGISSGWRTGQRWYRDVLRDGGSPIRSPQDMALFMRDWAGDVWNLQGLKGANERLDLVGRTAAQRVAESRGAGPTEAMIAGRDSSYDPDKAGTVMRAINGVIPFTNATVQGGAQFARALRDHPKATLATVTATLAPVMLAAEAWNRSDPQRAQVYDNVPQYLKDSGIVVVPPVEWGQGSDTRGAMPRYLWVPTEITTPFVVGMRAAMQHLDKVVPGLQPAAGRSDVNPDAPEWMQWAGVLNEALQIFNPTHGDTAAAVASGFVPPVIKQTLELGLNKDLYRGNQIMSEPADERASALSQGITQGAHWLGQKTGSPFLQNVRPSGVEHVLQADPAHYDIASGISDQVKPSPYKQAEQGRIANAPFVGGLASRFVRDTGGANLERAQGQTLNQQVQTILQSARMRPSEADLTVPTDYKGAALTRDEQLRWQRQANIEIQSGITDALDSKQWDDPMTRSQAVKDAISKAKERAAKDALGLTPRDIKDRMEQQSILQRQAVGAR